MALRSRGAEHAGLQPAIAPSGAWRGAAGQRSGRGGRGCAIDKHITLSADEGLIARAAVRDEADQAFMRVTGPADSACTDVLQTVYFEHHVDLTPWNQARPRTGWMLVKVMDQDVVRPNYNSNDNFSAVFWDADSPDLSDQGASSDVDGDRPAPAAHTRLDLQGDHAGSLLATEVPWRLPEEGCWSTFNPDIALSWEMDPQQEKRIRY